MRTIHLLYYRAIQFQNKVKRKVKWDFLPESGNILLIYISPNHYNLLLRECSEEIEYLRNEGYQIDDDEWLELAYLKSFKLYGRNLFDNRIILNADITKTKFKFARIVCKLKKINK